MATLASLLFYLAAVAASFGFTYLWYKTTPKRGSGWALFAGVLLAIFLNPHTVFLRVVVNLIFAVGYGLGWYKVEKEETRREYSGWLLVVAIGAALGVFL